MNDEQYNDILKRLNQVKLEKDSKMTVIVSGGMDSVTLLYLALENTTPDKITVLSFNYGQKHSKELDRAGEICFDNGIKHQIIELPSASELLKSSLTSKDQEIPHGHYAKDNMKQTVVPNRNAIMLSFAYGVAISNGSKYLLYGAHSGDHFIYPDCRPEFVDALDIALKLGNKGFGDVSIIAPFRSVSKSEIAALGLELGVPFEKTWSCYEGHERPCLKCGTCIERTEAFLDNKRQDPSLTKEEWVQAVKNHDEAVTEYKEVTGK